MASAAPKLLTLVFVHRPGAVLLGMKKRGFGRGKWNGFGGKREGSESMARCAQRELQEETSLSAPLAAFRPRGFLSFHMETDGMADAATGAVSKVLNVFIYSVDEAATEGAATESEEMAPKWYEHEQVPYASMWLDDPIWLPSLLGDDALSVAASFTFESEGAMRDDWHCWEFPASADFQTFLRTERDLGIVREPTRTGAAATAGADEEGRRDGVLELLFPEAGEGGGA